MREIRQFLNASLFGCLNECLSEQRPCWTSRQGMWYIYIYNLSPYRMIFSKTKYPIRCDALWRHSYWGENSITLVYNLQEQQKERKQKDFLLLARLFTEENKYVYFPYLFTSQVMAHLRAIVSKINVTPKGVRLSEKLEHSVMKFDRSNKFDLCYYGQVNSLRLKSSVALKWASKHLWE